MIENKSILALIPARGGSKGLPNKNIRMLYGKPLIAYSIIAAGESRYIDLVIVSTDSPAIKEVAEEYHASVPFLRPDNISGDTAPTSDAVLHALDWLKRHSGRTFNYIILLQPTSPCRTTDHIDRAIEVLHRHPTALSLVSVTETQKSPYWMKTINDSGFLEPFLQNDRHESRRQDLPCVFVPNGSIFLIKVSAFLEHQTFQTEYALPFIIEKKYSVDIDDETDLMLAELILRKKLL